MITYLLTMISTIWSFLKRHRWKSIFSLVGFVAIGGITYAALSPTQAEYITEMSQKGNLVQTVEAVGTVISDRDLELQFRSSGIIAQVLVKEGDSVKAGQRLASTRSGDLSASVAAAAARVKEAEASLRAMKEGTRPEEIAVAEAQLLNKRASLDIAKTTLSTAEENMKAAQTKLEALMQEANTNLSGQINQVSSITSRNVTTAEQALASIDSIFTQNREGSSDAYIVSTVNKSGIYNNMMNKKLVATNTIASAKLQPTPLTYKDALAYTELYKTAIQQCADALTNAYDLITSLTTDTNTVYLSSSALESYKNTIATNRSSAQSALNEIENWISSLRDASATYDTRIATEQSAFTSSKGTKDKAEADIKNYETSIQIDEAQLALKKAGNRQADIDAADARLRAARAEVARASAAIADTVINAPSNGKITKVNIKAGEIAPVGAAITMLGESPYRIEIFVSEIDIPKIKRDYPSTVELDAFPGVDYKLRVSEIDEAQTLVDGVAKYRVKLDFVFPHDEFKLGMTGDVRIVTGERNDVVYIPSRAVLEDGQRKYVRVLEGEMMVEKDVETGLEGEGGDIEITKGIELGENIIILVK